MLGKYDSLRDSALHFLCLADWANDSFGNVEAPTGYVWRISNDAQDVAVTNGEFNSVMAEFLEANDSSEYDELPLHDSLVGHFLVIEDSQGFVHIQRYDLEADLLFHFNGLQEEFNAWDEQED